LVSPLTTSTTILTVKVPLGGTVVEEKILVTDPARTEGIKINKTNKKATVALTDIISSELLLE
jgi:hypothetical protein